MRIRLAVALLLTAFLLTAGCRGVAAPTITPMPTATATASTVRSPAATPTSTPVRPLSPQPTAPRSANIPALGSIQKDVTYCIPDGNPQKMDLYFPRVSDGRPWPVVVYVHGGGWQEGDKTGGAGIGEMPLLTQRGYVFAAINYRLAPKWKWPAQIQDVKCAVRFLRSQAADYNLDPNRIGAIGGSAGGHLVSLLGVTDVGAGFDVGEYPGQSSRVRAVVDLFGPADLTVKQFTEYQANTIRTVFGVQSFGDPILAKASPVTYISKDDPPFLILQGDKDALVPLSQSQELYERLKAGGVPATLVVVKNAGHSFVPMGGPINPSLAELGKMVLDFFDKYLTTLAQP